MSKKLGKRVRVLNVRIIVNSKQKDNEIVEKIAEALDLEIGTKVDVESIEAMSGWKGSKEALGQVL